MNKKAPTIDEAKSGLKNRYELDECSDSTLHFAAIDSSRNAGVPVSIDPNKDGVKP